MDRLLTDVFLISDKEFQNSITNQNRSFMENPAVHFFSFEKLQLLCLEFRNATKSCSVMEHNGR